MFKLRPDGTTVRVNDRFVSLDPILYENGITPNCHVNIDTFFDKKRPDDVLLYELNKDKYALMIDQRVINLLSKVETVEYKFINCLTDAPEDSQSVNEVEIQIKDIRNAIEVYSEWCIYSMINYLPYADFAIDHMPIIDKVYINGVESQLFENITAYINDNLLCKTYNIDILRDGTYNTSHSKYSIEKDKNIYISYYRVNSHYPIFYFAHKSYRKGIRKLDHIEITLRWYEGKYEDARDYTVYAESIADDYMYSDTTLEGILTLVTVMPYLYQYYNHELKYMRDNYFLITVVTLYYRTKNGLSGFEIVDPNSKYIFNTMLDIYSNYIAMR